MPADPFAGERRRMVEEQIRARGISNERVLAAVEQVPRHLFVPENLRREAYEDHPLPIGDGQTISQPYIVALMTDLLDPHAGDRILEIGAGSGYQAAILAELATEVITIERIPAVAARARRNLSAAGSRPVEVIVGDGTLGYQVKAPYNGILITAGTPEVPQPLIDQLADRGRLVAPVGTRGVQELVRLVREGGGIRQEGHGAVVFVPLIGEHGWREHEG
ncbi:MAG TPA: protein-L-isoaspartate(D-aspartate) O-methyltransferase [Methanomicrobiales archaeon]|nr:protein-L-isoaspartate(D-aspartate) O-methyltransferase [Methanomicrobiales archaeon]